MTANTQSECPGLYKHSPSFSKLYLFGGLKLDRSIRPGTPQTWKQSQFPFGADVNGLCRSHLQHHGAHLRTQLARYIDLSPSPLFWARAGRDHRKSKRGNNIQSIFTLKLVSKSNAEIDECEESGQTVTVVMNT